MQLKRKMFKVKPATGYCNGCDLWKDKCVSGRIREKLFEEHGPCGVNSIIFVLKKKYRK